MTRKRGVLQYRVTTSRYNEKCGAMCSSIFKLDQMTTSLPHRKRKSSHQLRMLLAPTVKQASHVRISMRDGECPEFYQYSFTLLVSSFLFLLYLLVSSIIEQYPNLPRSLGSKVWNYQQAASAAPPTPAFDAHPLLGSNCTRTTFTGASGHQLRPARSSRLTPAQLEFLCFLTHAQRHRLMDLQLSHSVPFPQRLVLHPQICQPWPILKDGLA